MARVDDFRTWWPWLRHFDGRGLAVGSTWAAVVQPPLPYRLRFEIHLDEVEASRRVVAHVTGDIVGTAHLQIAPIATGSELHLVSELAPASAILRSVARIAAPAARAGHEWVLGTGLRQFRAGAFAGTDRWSPRGESNS